jgi:4'-phosphopantetheinyl transferase
MDESPRTCSRRCESRLQAERGVIDVWTVNLDVSSDICTSLLSQDEQTRAARFRFEIHRKRFICGRAALRKLLAGYLDAHPVELQFGYSTNGKPFLRNPAKSLSFNVAHCEGLALIAIAALESQIGVDVERVRWLPDFEELVSRFFSKREVELFGALRPEHKPSAFFNLWTRKEAWLKATGQGVCAALDQVEVTFLPGEPAQLLSLPGSPVSNWRLRDFSPAEGFVAALATAIADFRVRVHRFDVEQPMTFAEPV